MTWKQAEADPMRIAEWLQRFRTDAISAQGVSPQSPLYGAPSRSILERDKTSDAERNYPYGARSCGDT